MPSAFVEEYRKELSLTGYPFSACVPLLTDTGYSFAIGTIEDASIYYDAQTKVPVFSSIQKVGRMITFTIGDYAATFSLNAMPEVLELYTGTRVFGGILVLNTSRLRILTSWKDGLHTFVSPQSFCPRCIELVPPVGVQRLITDEGDILSGEVVISGGPGAVFELLVSPSGITYIEVHFVGDPTYTSKEAIIPVQKIICSDTFGTEVTLIGDAYKNVSMIASNFFEGNLFDDALRIEGFNNTVNISLGGK